MHFHEIIALGITTVTVGISSGVFLAEILIALAQ